MVSAIDSKSEPSWVRDFISLSDVEFNSKNNGALGFSIGIFVEFLKNILFFAFFLTFLKFTFMAQILFYRCPGTYGATTSTVVSLLNVTKLRTSTFYACCHHLRS